MTGGGLRPTHLELSCFRGWESGEVDLSAPLTVVVGANGAGKSSLLGALEWCLLGREAEKKQSGVAERGDWEVRRRDTNAPVRVALRLAGAAGELVVERARAATARKADPDELAITEDGVRCEGDAAMARLAALGLSDAATWRRAFCQHQELPRTRAVEAADRSTVLATLLGLDEGERLRDELAALRHDELLRELDAELAALDATALRLASRPLDDLLEAERRLATLGVDRARLGPGFGEELARAIEARASSLAERLGAELAPAPETGSLAAFCDWAEAVPEALRAATSAGGREEEAARRRPLLQEALERLGLARTRHSDALERLERSVRERGDGEARAGQLERAREAEREAERALAREDETAALLRAAREQLLSESAPDRCPVCASAVPGLVGKIDATLRERDAGASGPEERTSELHRSRDSARARRAAAEESLREHGERQRDEVDARDAHERARAELGALVPDALGPAAAAREELGALGRSLSALRDARAIADADMTAHRRDVDRLHLFLRWRAVEARSGREADLSTTVAWSALESALDAAAGFAADADALAGLARELQEEKARRREREVNEALGEHLAAIVGEGAGRAARVRVSRTNKRLVYDLVDEDERPVLPVLEQSRTGALAIALLLSQAEARAREGEPAFVVLDDPSQGMDDARATGLAEALLRAAEHAPVIVATPSGALADALATKGDTPRRVVILAEPAPGHAARVSEEMAR